MGSKEEKTSPPHSLELERHRFAASFPAEGRVLASHKAQICQDLLLSIPDGKQGLGELYSSPEHTQEDDAVMITLRNKADKQL